jgi:ribose 5-phosphate isomerase A
MDDKKAVAMKALEYVEDGMVLGMGTGSTFDVFLDLMKERGIRNITGVCTSKRTEEKARAYGFRILDINEAEHIDLAIDGADEVDPGLNLIKGHGNALTREKIIDYRADRFIVIADASKEVKSLGEKKTVPIEVLPFGWKWVEKDLGIPAVKKDVVTDNGNYIVHVVLKDFDPVDMEKKLNNIPGVVDNGIFTKCDVAILGEKVLKR